MARVVFAVVLLLVVAFCGTEVLAQTHHFVGGDDGWSSDMNVSSWLAGRDFRVGDKLWFMYPEAENTIAELQSLEEFVSCDITNPIRMYSDGLNDVTLEKEGTRYFTSGDVENCKNGMKIPIPVQPSPDESEPPTQPEPLPPIHPAPATPLVPTPPDPVPVEPPVHPEPEPPLVPTPPEPVPVEPPVHPEPEPPLVPTPPVPVPVEPPVQPEPEPLPPFHPEPAPPLVPTPLEPAPIEPPSAKPPPYEPSPPKKPEPLPPIHPEPAPPLVPTPPKPVPLPPPCVFPPPLPSAATTLTNVLSFVYYALFLSYFVL